MMLRSLEKSLGPLSPSSSSVFQRVICILRARASHRAKKSILLFLFSVIPKAFNQTLHRRVFEADADLQDDSSKFVDLSVKLDEPDYNQLFLVTFTSFVGLGILISIIMLIVNIKSPIFNICSELGKSKDKFIIPLPSQLKEEVA